LADDYICDASSTKVTRIIFDFRIAFVKLSAWDATKQKTKPVPDEAFDEFSPERAEPSPSAPSEPKVKAKAKQKNGKGQGNSCCSQYVGGWSRVVGSQRWTCAPAWDSYTSTLKKTTTSIAIATATETSAPTTATSERLRRTEISHGGGSGHVCTVDGKY